MAPERPITPPCLMAARSAPSSPVSTTQNHQQLYQYQIASPDGIRIHLQDSSDQEEYNGVETREVRVETSPDDDLTSLSWLHDRNLLKGTGTQGAIMIIFFYSKNSFYHKKRNYGCKSLILLNILNVVCIYYIFNLIIISEINLTSTPTTRTVILHQNITHSTRTFQHHNSMNSNNGDASSTGNNYTKFNLIIISIIQFLNQLILLLNIAISIKWQQKDPDFSIIITTLLSRCLFIIFLLLVLPKINSNMLFLLL